MQNVFAKSPLCWWLKIMCHGREEPSVAVSPPACSRSSGLKQWESGSSLNCLQDSPRGECWSLWCPIIFSQTEKKWNWILHIYGKKRAQTSSIVGADCGKLQAEECTESWCVKGTARWQRQAQKQLGDEKPSPCSLQYSAWQGDLLRVAGPALAARRAVKDENKCLSHLNIHQALM